MFYASKSWTSFPKSEFDENEMGGNAEWNRRYAADELVWKGGVKIKLAMEIGKVKTVFKAFPRQSI